MAKKYFVKFRKLAISIKFTLFSLMYGNIYFSEFYESDIEIFLSNQDVLFVI